MSTEIMVLGKSGKIICDAQELKIYLKEYLLMIIFVRLILMKIKNT
jgi:hypothetical protein